MFSWLYARDNESLAVYPDKSNPEYEHVNSADWLALTATLEKYDPTLGLILEVVVATSYGLELSDLNHIKLFSKSAINLLS